MVERPRVAVPFAETLPAPFTVAGIIGLQVDNQLWRGMGPPVEPRESCSAVSSKAAAIAVQTIRTCASPAPEASTLHRCKRLC